MSLPPGVKTAYFEAAYVQYYSASLLKRKRGAIWRQITHPLTLLQPLSAEGRLL